MSLYEHLQKMYHRYVDVGNFLDQDREECIKITLTFSNSFEPFYNPEALHPWN